MSRIYFLTIIEQPCITSGMVAERSLFQINQEVLLKRPVSCFNLRQDLQKPNTNSDPSPNSTVKEPIDSVIEQRGNIELFKDHQWALYLWGKEINQQKNNQPVTSASGFTLVNIDTHHDLSYKVDHEVLVDQKNADILSDKIKGSSKEWDNALEEETRSSKIGDYIVKAVAFGWSREMYWIRPDSDINHSEDKYFLVEKKKLGSSMSVSLKLITSSNYQQAKKDKRDVFLLHEVPLSQASKELTLSPNKTLATLDLDTFYNIPTTKTKTISVKEVKELFKESFSILESIKNLSDEVEVKNPFPPGSNGANEFAQKKKITAGDIRTTFEISSALYNAIQGKSDSEHIKNPFDDAHETTQEEREQMLNDTANFLNRNNLATPNKKLPVASSPGFFPQALTQEVISSLELKLKPSTNIIK